MFGNRLIKSNNAGAACTTDTVQILGDTSCIAYYKMSDATDETGSYDGTPTNVNFNVAGKFGNAGEFNGSSSYVLAPSFMPTGSNPRSASAWVKTTVSNANMTILFYGAESNNNAFIFRVINGQLGVAFWANDHDFTATGLTDGNWHHVVATYDGSLAKLYLDGNLIGTGSAGAVSTSSANLAIGAYNNGTDALFNGSIDQVRIFNRAITANEVETLYYEVQCIPTIVPSEHFNPVLYTGDGTTNNPITSLDFQPDLVWIKNRNSTQSHRLYDSVRGANLQISSNQTAVESNSGGLTSFDSNGFSLDNWASVNTNNNTYVAWNWKAGGAEVAATSIEATSATRSANVDAGFSIMKFHTSASTASPPPMNYIEHGLDATPEMVIYKSTSNTGDWRVMHVDNGQKWVELNTTDVAAGPFPETIWDNTSTNIGVRSNYAISRDADYIAYAFHSVDGYSKFGSYVGSSASNFIVTGFRPAFVMIKRTNLAGGRWVMVDDKRGDGGFNVAKILNAQDTLAELTASTYGINFNSNGFSIPAGASGNINTANNTYIFMAFAADPTTIEPTLEDSFNTVTYTGNGGTQSITSLDFQPDLVWIKERTSTSGHFISDSIRGATKVIYSNLANSEDTETNVLTSFDTNGFTVGNSPGVNASTDDYVAWSWKAAELPAINSNGSITSVVSANPAAGFSIVKYTGENSASDTVGHGMTDVEMIILKDLTDGTNNWRVWHKDLTANYWMYLNLTLEERNSASDGGIRNVDANTFGFINGTSAGVEGVNSNASDYIAYCFHSVDGYQKVGSYLGNTSTLPSVNLGFEPGWVMIKEATDTGSWLIYDSVRPSDPATQNNKILFANDSASESTSTGNILNFTSTGFDIEAGSSELNTNGNTYIYLAFANQF